ncbi:cupin-like domain-containing protein [Hyaloraphidium curvatum]|nr:cupin-like domain-containing protein [Hyaloraphidium curvatum]
MFAKRSVRTAEGDDKRKRPRAEDVPNGKHADAGGNAVAPEDPRLAPTFANAYSGFAVPSKDYALERVDLDSLTPELFFRDYVAKRKPVVLRGFLKDADFTAPSKWTNEYLAEKAGDETIAVERRESDTAKFGRGIEVDMTFKELLDLIAAGDEMHYLTTQDVDAEPDGRPEIMAPFIKRLRSDFPLRPALAGGLVPQNINAWMGNNKHGSSTGLHHDYHDNLYVLLRGRKRFRLYSPADAGRMYTRGVMTRVHANGRICYEGEETTAYGADPMAEAAALAEIERDEAEKELEEAEKAAERGVEGAEERVRRAEKRLDAAMEAMLGAEIGDDEGLDEEAGSDDEDGDSGSGNEGGADSFGDEEDGGDQEDAEDQEDAASDPEAPANGTPPPRKADRTVKDPLNFSLVDTSLLTSSPSTLSTRFPLFTDALPAWCELEAGEMLYLPASWFHEVESFGAEGGHLALNYWFHPPDALKNFERPYSSEFWERDWRMRFADVADGAKAEE